MRKDNAEGLITNDRGLRLSLMAAAGALSVVFALRAVGHVDKFSLIWPVSGMELALLLAYRHPKPIERVWSVLAGAAGVFLGGLTVGMPTLLALYIAALTSTDCVIGCLLMGPGTRCFDDLKRTGNAIRFGLTTFVPPLVTGVLGAYPISVLLHESLRLTAQMNFLANSLGIALFLPVWLFVLTGEPRRLAKLVRQQPASYAWFAIFFAVTVFVFWQTNKPFLFIVFPPLIGIVVSIGLEGGVMASMSVAVIGWYATAHHHGPLWLNHSATPNERLMTLQVFVWVFLATGLSTGAIVDERRRIGKELQELSSIYHILVDNSPDVIVLSSLDGVRRYVSPAIEQLTGWTPKEYLALNRLDTLHPEDHAIGTTLLNHIREGHKERTIRYRMMRKDGGWRWVETIVKGYGGECDEEIAGYVATVRDITAIKQTEESWEKANSNLVTENQRVAALTIIDGLTGLVNRRGFDEAMARLKHRRQDDKVALMMIDVDLFKKYNDALGHPQGDECLRRLAMVFSARIKREGDLVARYGGEEFAIILNNADTHAAQIVAWQLLETVRGLRLEHPDSAFRVVTLSIGISALGPGAGSDPSALVVEADCALYESKRAGRNRVSQWGTLSLERQEHLSSQA